MVADPLSLRVDVVVPGGQDLLAPKVSDKEGVRDQRPLGLFEAL